ncbi:hypothetical protein Tco_1201204 [Tanacetum coccineum]
MLNSLAAGFRQAVEANSPQIREQVREEYRTGAVTSGSNPPPVTIHTWLERFNKQKPRSFEKAVAPVDAENWISHMEKIFDVMDSFPPPTGYSWTAVELAGKSRRRTFVGVFQKAISTSHVYTVYRRAQVADAHATF